ncbi:MAG: hypothetical protein GX909_03205, partial [Clostridiaceae bacterium]|nr:hypothetical protein [Clostridiaceae bacterium]
MNLVIIGGTGAVKIKDLVEKCYDDIEVQVFKDTDIFLKEVLLRNMDIHRLMLMQDGIEYIEDERVYNFVDYMLEHYPATRIITVSKDEDVNNFLGELVTSPYALHFLIKGSIKTKIVLDIVSKEISVLKNIYNNILYQKEATGMVDIVDGPVVEDKDVIVPPKGKRGFLTKVFGIGYKGGSQKSNQQNQRQKIGQGYGVDEFSQVSDEEEPDLSFGLFDSEESDIGIGIDGREVFETLDHDDTDLIEDDADDWLDTSIEELENDFNTDFKDNDVTEEAEDFELDLSDDFDITSSDEWEDGNWDNDNDFESIDEWGEVSSDFGSFEDLDFEETTSNEETKKRRLTFEDIKQEIESKSIPVNSLDFEVENPVIDMDLEEVEESETLGDIDLEDLMQDYEESNVKVVEKVKVIEKVIENGGQRNFRNKNGVRVVIVTGDRRVGATKLSMNLANIFSKQEKTLLVDLDRYRKGSISYMNIYDLIDEPEHIQNGLTHLKSIKMLPNVTYLYPRGSFYCLLSMYGEEVTDEQVDRIQKILYSQREYQTVVIDCPIENLYLLSD